jgi:hypothetical protein
MMLGHPGDVDDADIRIRLPRPFCNVEASHTIAQDVGHQAPKAWRLGIQTGKARPFRRALPGRGGTAPFAPRGITPPWHDS